MKQIPHEFVFQWNCESSSQAVAELVDRFVNLLTQYSWPESNIFEIHTALVELINNALEHGNRYDASKKIFLSGRVAPDGLRFCLRDEGNGFDYQSQNVMTNVPDPLAPRGRGLFLVRNMVTRMSFNQAGNEVILEKEITPTFPGTQRE